MPATEDRRTRCAFASRHPPARPLPDWWPGDERPLVYVSYGSVRPTLPGFAELFRATVDALSGLEARVLFTIGTEVERDALGPAPDNVRVEAWVPQADVMPHAAAMITHGGAGQAAAVLTDWLQPARAA
jgi:UDP:flavonoid glycosyltransferase YjiC (YdhE family)